MESMLIKLHPILLGHSFRLPGNRSLILHNSKSIWSTWSSCNVFPFLSSSLNVLLSLSSTRTLLPLNVFRNLAPRCEPGFNDDMNHFNPKLRKFFRNHDRPLISQPTFGQVQILWRFSELLGIGSPGTAQERVAYWGCCRCMQSIMGRISRKNYKV
jgi:hypothetical protein